MKLRLLPHAIQRFRERWTETGSHTDEALAAHLFRAIAVDEECGEVFQSGTNTFYPLSFMGRDGYVVVRDGAIRTVQLPEYCPEVEEVRNGRS